MIVPTLPGSLSTSSMALKKPVIARVNAEWRAVLSEALAEPRERYGIDMPLAALVALVITFNEGMIFERLSGIETGQAELLEWIDTWLTDKEEGR
jgi:hypothetical protein